MKNWKMKLALTLTIALTLPTTQALSANQVTAQAPSSKTVFINDQPIRTTVIMQNDLQLVPASFFRQLNVNVEWNKSARTAQLRGESVEVSFPTGERLAQTRRLDEAAKTKNDVLKTRTVLINGSTYIPLAYTARELGFNVTYDTAKRAAIVHTRDKASFVPLATQNQAGSGQILANAGQQTADTTYVQATAEELYWLYQITEAEAGGESYDGRVAVAASILNRVADPVWPNSIIDTIFQVEYYNGKAYVQYSPVLDKRIHSVIPSEATKRAVQEALNGTDPSEGAVVFFNPDKTDNAWVHSRPVTVKIGNHVFAK